MKQIKTMLIVLLMTSVFVTKAQSQKKFSPPKATVENTDPAPTMKKFLTKNPTVADVRWKKENNIIIKLKSGKTTIYDLGNPQEKKTFENNYGLAPGIPPPPPSVKKSKSK